MCNLEFVRKEVLSEKKIRNVYKSKISFIKLCEKVIQLPEYKKTKIRVTIEGAEMEPDERITLDSFDEIKKIAEKSRVSMILFRGIYNKKEVNIIVDADLEKLIITADDSKVMEDIRGRLEEEI